MSKITVLGAGRMSDPIIYALQKLGFDDIIVCDHDELALNVISKKYSNITVSDHIVIHDRPVLSTLPTKENYQVAKRCAANQVPYFDLGGNMDVERKIQKIVKRKKLIFQSGLGLAPGLVNHFAEHAARRRPAITLHMMCGNLPVRPNALLNYKITSSTDGLWDRYNKKFVYMHNKKKVHGPAMSQCGSVVIKDNTYECFLSHGEIDRSLDMLTELGVGTFAYKTLRWPGHCKWIQHLRDTCGLKKETIIQIMQQQSYDYLQDFVLIYIIVKPNTYDTDYYTIQIDKTDHFSAMQRATGFSAAAEVYTILEGGIDDRPRFLQQYFSVLKDLGIVCPLDG